MSVRVRPDAEWRLTPTPNASSQLAGRRSPTFASRSTMARRETPFCAALAAGERPRISAVSRSYARGRRRVPDCLPGLSHHDHGASRRGGPDSYGLAHDGHHQGEWPSPLGPIAPTGTPISFTGTTTLRVTEGRIVEVVGTNHDHLGILQQMGALPAGRPRPGA